jgi:hypothetical protein
MHNPHAALRLIATQWETLHDRLPDRPADNWPPVMGITHMIDRLDADEAAALREARAAERAARLDGDAVLAPGARPVPLNIDVLDTLRYVESVLLPLADCVAAAVQRPSISGPPAGRNWPPEDWQRRRQLAREDADDPRRWPYHCAGEHGRRRTVPFAALWLLARLDGEAGPFRPLGLEQHALIVRKVLPLGVAVRRALGEAREAVPVSFPCPHCRGALRMHSGDGRPPAVECVDCGWRRTAPNAA